MSTEKEEFGYAPGALAIFVGGALGAISIWEGVEGRDMSEELYSAGHIPQAERLHAESARSFEHAALGGAIFIVGGVVVTSTYKRRRSYGKE